ncbi:MAG TPA: MFS transporter [Myxococcota bacterium]|nr:MFS transporter [Myxococcota bacterium]
MSVWTDKVGGDARRLVATRAVRGVADGLVSVVLATYLPRLGLSAFEVGVVVAGTLGGSAALTLLVGLHGHRFPARTILIATAGLMAVTGIAFSLATAFWALLLISVVGTLNPSSGDVTPFLPTEQALMAESVAARDRTTVFAWYNVAGALAGAVGALLAGLPEVLAGGEMAPSDTILGFERASFYLYAVAGLVALVLYGRLPRVETPKRDRSTRALATSRPVVVRLAALFALDSFGGGLVIQSLLALWLTRRFDVGPEVLGVLFFATGVVAGASQFVSAWLTARIGHIKTMVYTHLPANVFLVLAGLMPTAELAMAFLVLRMCLSQMDVPARQAYVMAVVPPEERVAAAAVTNVPRSLAPAFAPLVTGALLDASTFGWPLILAGTLKIIYDLLLYRGFAALKAREE